MFTFLDVDVSMTSQTKQKITCSYNKDVYHVPSWIDLSDTKQKIEPLEDYKIIYNGVEYPISYAMNGLNYLSFKYRNPTDNKDIIAIDYFKNEDVVKVVFTKQYIEFVEGSNIKLLYTEKPIESRGNGMVNFGNVILKFKYDDALVVRVVKVIKEDEKPKTCLVRINQNTAFKITYENGEIRTEVI